MKAEIILYSFRSGPSGKNLSRLFPIKNVTRVLIQNRGEVTLYTRTKEYKIKLKRGLNSRLRSIRILPK